jgi:hypothetical protein
MMHFGKAQPLVFLRQTDEYRLAAATPAPGTQVLVKPKFRDDVATLPYFRRDSTTAIRRSLRSEGSVRSGDIVVSLTWLTMSPLSSQVGLW